LRLLAERFMLPPLNGGSNYERDLNMFTICQTS
jgi:hypothetical protein